MSKRVRLIRCPRCDHRATLPKSVATTAKLRCSACNAQMLVRHAIEGEGGRPCRWRDPAKPSVADVKAERAREVIERYGGVLHDDRVDDLWRRDDAVGT